MTNLQPLKIWGRQNSVNVQKVMWVVEELQIPHLRVDAGMQHGAVKDAWYMAMNPNSRVPTIDDGGFVLWESNTITRYLCTKFDHPTLLPRELEKCSLANQWMDWATSTMAPIMTPLFWGLIRTPVEKQDPIATNQLRLQMESVMSILDSQLSRHTHVCGDNFTMGDIPIGCFAHRWYLLPIERREFIHLRRWYGLLTQRSAYQKHVMMPLS